MQSSKWPNVITYWRRDFKVFALVTVSGVIYDAGLVLIPYLLGRIIDSYSAGTSFKTILTELGLYLLAVFVVMFNRALKRYEVRRFANDVNLWMKGDVFASFLSLPVPAIKKTAIGDDLSKALSDVSNAAEGMRKLTTEIYDTGLLLASYVAYLLYLDWKVALLSLIPLPFAVMALLLLRRSIYQANRKVRRQASLVSEYAYDLFDNATLYRVFGRGEDNVARFSDMLDSYRKKAVAAGVLSSSLSPVFYLLALTGLFPLIMIGGREVGQSGLTLGLFTSMISVFLLLAKKTMSLYKLVGSVEKGEASLDRIRPLLQKRPQEALMSYVSFGTPVSLKATDLRIEVNGKVLIADLSFALHTGMRVGITGPIASGKSLLLKTLVGETPYGGSLELNGREVKDRGPSDLARFVTYMGHDPELFSDTLRNNVALGAKRDPAPYVSAAGLNPDVREMPNGLGTVIGPLGVNLSGGQMARLAYARTLYHAKPVVVLDDPFASIDSKTTNFILSSSKPLLSRSLVLLVSHRIDFFPDLDLVIYLDGKGHSYVGTHEKLYSDVLSYRRLYDIQQGGLDHERK